MKKQNNGGWVFAALVIVLVLVGGAFWLLRVGEEQESSGAIAWSKEPLQFDAGKIPMTVTKRVVEIDITAEDLAGWAVGCGTAIENGHLLDLEAKLQGINKTQYRFTFDGESQLDDTYLVTLIPNVAGYTSLNALKKDFEICDAGVQENPVMFNSDWLVFTNACGTGFDDGSGRAHGCQEVKDAIEPTLSLK